MNEHTCSATSPSDALIRAATPGSVAETPGAFANMDDQLPPHRPPARSTEPKLLEQAQPGLDLIHRFPSRGSWRRMPPGKAEPGEERGFPGGAWTGWAFHQERFLSKSEALDLGRQERDWAYLRAAEPVMPWLPGGTPPPITCGPALASPTNVLDLLLPTGLHTHPPPCSLALGQTHVSMSRT